MLTLLLVVTVLIYQRCFRRFDAEGYGRFGCPAEFLTFRSGEQKLQGYLFGRGDTLVVLAPGLGNGAFSYAAQIRWLVMAGRRVFAFDYTGCYGSEGRSCRGFPQAAGDLKAALDFVESKGRFGSTRLCLLGHSMGGYAVCNAMPDYRVDAAVCVGGVNSAMEATISPVIAKVGPLAYLHYPFLWAYQALRFGVRALRQSAAGRRRRRGGPYCWSMGSTTGSRPCTAPPLSLIWGRSMARSACSGRSPAGTVMRTCYLATAGTRQTFR